MIVDDGQLSYKVNGKDLGIAYDDNRMDRENLKAFICLGQGDSIELLKGSG